MPNENTKTPENDGIGAPHVKDYTALAEKAINNDESVKKTINFAREDDKFGFTEDQLLRFMSKKGRDFYDASIEVASNGQSRLMTADKAMNALLLPDDSGLDGFERLVKHLDIRLKPDLERGIPCDSLDLFFTTPYATPLVPEYISRTLLKQSMKDYTLGDIVARTEFTTNGTFQQAKVDFENTKTGMGRVSEFAKSPVARLKMGNVAMAVGDRSLALQLSYKSLKNISIDLFSLFLKLVARQDDEDLLTRAVAVLTAAAGTPVGKTSLGSGMIADDGNLPYKVWLEMTRKTNGYNWNRGVARGVTCEAVMLMQTPNPDPIQMNALYASILNEKLKSQVSMSNIDRVPTVLKQSEKAVANQIVLFDKEYALVHVKEIGVDMVEYDKVINGRFEEVVVTKSDDFYVLVDDAVKAYNEI